MPEEQCGYTFYLPLADNSADSDNFGSLFFPSCSLNPQEGTLGLSSRFFVDSGKLFFS